MDFRWRMESWCDSTILHKRRYLLRSMQGMVFSIVFQLPFKMWTHQSYLNRHAPPSVLNVRQGQHVELRVAKRLEEDYVPPKGAKIFSGSGHRLGAVVPEVATGNRSSAMPGSFPSASSAVSSTPSSADRPKIPTSFEVDQTQPTTSIQIRLADGTRCAVIYVPFPRGIIYASI